MVASSGSSSAVSSQTDPYDEAWARVADAILETPGTLPADVRRAIADGNDPPELAALLDKVRRHAYRIIDADLAGLDVDTTIEAVLAAALGEGELRRAAALEAIG
jgi:hypothetical protein